MVGTRTRGVGSMRRRRRGIDEGERERAGGAGRAERGWKMENGEREGRSGLRKGRERAASHSSKNALQTSRACASPYHSARARTHTRPLSSDQRRSLWPAADEREREKRAFSLDVHFSHSACVRSTSTPPCPARSSRSRLANAATRSGPSSGARCVREREEGERERESKRGAWAAWSLRLSRVLSEAAHARSPYAEGSASS